MKVSDYLKDNMISLDLKAGNKEEVIKELGGLLKQEKGVINYEMLLKDVWEREKLATTGIGNEVALPHARTDSAKKFVIAFGRSEQGIDFESLDNKKAKLFFLMGTPKTEGLQRYLKLLAHLTRLLRKNTFRDSLLKAQSPLEIIKVFTDNED